MRTALVIMNGEYYIISIIKTSFLIFLVILPCLLHAQWSIDINFEKPSITNQYISIDTTPGNIWQIGKPDKKNYTPKHLDTNVIITGLSNSYPINTTSAFILKIDRTIYYHDINLNFSYKIDSDSLNDYGLIELSRDNGKTWANITETDTFKHKWVFNYSQYVTKPVFTGVLTNQWHRIGYQMDNTYIKETDTLLFRFSFISDSIYDNRDGWMIDDINFNNVEVSLLEDQHNKIDNFVEIYPNIIKAQSNFTILCKNSSINNIKIYNLQGIKLFDIEKPDVSTFLNSAYFEKGMYFLRAETKFGNIETHKLIIE